MAIYNVENPSLDDLDQILFEGRVPNINDPRLDGVNQILKANGIPQNLQEEVKKYVFLLILALENKIALSPVEARSLLNTFLNNQIKDSEKINSINTAVTKLHGEINHSSRKRALDASTATTRK